MVAPAGPVALTVTSLEAMSARSPSHAPFVTPPSRIMESEPAAELSLKTRAPVRSPQTVGGYETCTLQNALTASGFGAIGQSVAPTAKSPVVVIELMSVGPVPAPKTRSVP